MRLCQRRQTSGSVDRSRLISSRSRTVPRSSLPTMWARPLRRCGSCQRSRRTRERDVHHPASLNFSEAFLPGQTNPINPEKRGGAQSRTAEALLGLGGNVGDVRATLARAVTALCDGSEVQLVARSSDYRTPPWGLTDQ